MVNPVGLRPYLVSGRAFVGGVVIWQGCLGVRQHHQREHKRIMQHDGNIHANERQRLQPSWQRDFRKQGQTHRAECRREEDDSRQRIEDLAQSIEYQNEGTMSRLAKGVKKSLREGLSEVSELLGTLEKMEKIERSGRGSSGNVNEPLLKVKQRVVTRRGRARVSSNGYPRYRKYKLDWREVGARAGRKRSLTEGFGDSE